MRTATVKVGASVMLMAAGLAVSQATAGAQPDGQQVRYTVSSAGPSEFTVSYLTAQPPSMDAYNADAYAFMKRERVTVTPEAPWVFETTLADPQWAFIQVSAPVRGGVAAPNARCEVTAGDQVVVAQDHPYSPQCYGGQW